MSGVFAGMLIVIAASVFQGSFAVPMTYARKWKWENSWMVFAIFGMIIMNIVLSVLTVPGLLNIYKTAGLSNLVIPTVFGIVFGFGAITFGIGLSTVGLALGYAIMLGTVLGMGTFIPMAVLHPEEIFTYKGIAVLAGLVLTLTGIAISGFAGIRKEKEQGKLSGEMSKNSRFSMKTGIAICVFSGLCSSAINIGFALSGNLVETAVSMGTQSNWAGNSVWAILFSFGGIVNIGYCVYLMRRDNTAECYREGGFLRNLGLIFFMSLMWIGSFILYGVGANMMGNWGTVIGWSVYMALSIALGNFWGIVQGEWKGASLATRKLMAEGVAVIIAAIAVLGYSSAL